MRRRLRNLTEQRIDTNESLRALLTDSAIKWAQGVANMVADLLLVKVVMPAQLHDENFRGPHIKFQVGKSFRDGAVVVLKLMYKDQRVLVTISDANRNEIVTDKRGIVDFTDSPKMAALQLSKEIEAADVL